MSVATETHLGPTLAEIIVPVFEEMEAGPIRESLTNAVLESGESLATIEESFRLVTAKRHEPEQLKRFFQNWGQTNHSAASVAGLSGRITLAAHALDDSAQLEHYRVVDSLQRIIDEDFGSGGEIPHADLYYRMATTIIGDDSWQSQQYRSRAAGEFRSWLSKQRLKNRDLFNGLLHILIHEVYTHGEVEFIHPLFQELLPAHYGMPVSESRKVLAWITVHTAGTETNHFRHATSGVQRYCSITGKEYDAKAATELFKTYLDYKAAVMDDLISGLR